MKKQLMLLCTFLAGLFTTNASAQEWVSSVPTGGDIVYLMADLNDGKLHFLNNNNGFDDTPQVAWTVSGNFPTSYTLTSEGGKVALRKPFSETKVETNSDRTGDDVTLSSILDNGMYTIYRSKKFTAGGNRNIVADANGISLGSNATCCWKFVTQKQIEDNGLGIITPMNSKIQNPKFESNENGWTFTGTHKRNTNNGVDGKAGHLDFGKWSTSAVTPSDFESSAAQTVSNLPSGTYKIVAKVQASADCGIQIKANSTSASYVGHEEVNGTTGIKGWDKMSAYCTVGEDGNLTLQFVASLLKEGALMQWANVDDIELTYLGTSNMVLSDDILENYNDGEEYDHVTLHRQLSASYWNPLTLPFDYTVPEEWEAFTMTKERAEGEDIVLTMTKATKMEAGKAYIVKPAQDVAMIKADGVTVTTQAQNISDEDADDVVGFNATLQPTVLDGNASDIRYLSQSNTIKKLTAVALMKGYRAYFNIGTASNSAKGVMMQFGEPEETAVQDVLNALQQNDIYDLNGRRQSTLKQGINIIGGKKVLVK